MVQLSITYPCHHLLRNVPLLELLFAFPLETAEFLRRVDIVLGWRRLMGFPKRSSLLRFRLLVGSRLAFPSQFAHTINNGEMTVFSPSLHPYRRGCRSSTRLTWSLALLLLLLLLSLKLGKYSLVGLLQSALVGPEVLCFGHLGGKTFQLYPALEAFPWRSST